MRRTDTQERRGRWEYVWPPPVPERLTWSQELPPPIWIPFPWWPLPRMWSAAAGKRQLSGSGYCRRDHACHKAQHDRKRCDEAGRHDPQGLYHREKRPARPGAGGRNEDVTALKAEYTYKEPEEIRPSTEKITHLDIENAVQMIAKAKRPFIFVGGGAILSNAAEEVRTFVQKVNAPVAVSLMGKGSFPETDELYTGMIGMHVRKPPIWASCSVIF